MRAPASLRMLGYLGAIVASVGVVLIGVVLDWKLADRSHGDGKLRLRWHVVADAPIMKGTLIQKKHLCRRLSRIPEDGEFITSTQDVVGVFAPTDLERGTPLKSVILSHRLAFEAPPGGAVVSINVESAAAVTICPGMRIAFVKKTSGQSDSKDPEMLPSPAKTEPKSAELNEGFVVLSVSSPEECGSHTVVTVAVHRLDEAKMLAAFDWRAIVLGGETENQD